jgi:membrane protein
MKPIKLWHLTVQTSSAWNNDNALQLGAALAYYAVFSISPLLIIILAVAGFLYRGDSFAYIYAQIAMLAGNNAADTITSTIKSVHSSEHGFAATVVSVIILFFGASGVFVQLQSSMNQIWGVKPKPGYFWTDFLKGRLLSVAMILGLGFLLLISLVLSAALSAGSDYFEDLLPGATWLWQTLDAGVSFAIVVLLFASIFKAVPDVRIGWNDVWVGALLTAILFTGGKSVIGLYLGRSSLGSAFGAAGSLLVVLAWMYYSSQILFFGAEFTKIYAEEHRVSIKPSKGAEYGSPGIQLP